MIACIFDLLACIGVDLSPCNDFVVCGVDLDDGSLMFPNDGLIVLDLHIQNCIIQHKAK